MVSSASSGPAERPDAGDGGIFAAGGEAGRLMAAYDWSSSPIGPVESWPASLRYAVRTVLVSRFPMVLTWGPEFTQFYNDGYAPMIGAQHPAIGEDIRTTLSAAWDALGPPIAHAMTTLESSWFPALQLLLERAGYREETYFTVTHAPAFGDDGTVAGMNAVCHEVTGQIIGARRQRLLHELAAAGGRVSDEAETVASMCRALDDDRLDVPFAAVYLAGEDAQLRRVAAVGCDLGLLPEVTGTGAAEVLAGIDRLGVTGGPWDDPVTEAVVLPLGIGRDGGPLGVLVVGKSPNLALDEEHRAFHELMGAQFAGAVATARAFEAERRRAESLAELDRAKTTFFSDVSHELRTPLTLLLGPIRDVLDDPAAPLPDGVHEQLSLALRNGQRLQRLVNDLLDFASIEAGRSQPVRVETDIATFTADLAGIFRAAAERAGLRLTVDCPPLGRPAYVDPQMWEKVVVNLLANAVKYTFVGGIDVALRADGERFVLTVTDTGVGIVPEELPRLFQRFHRVPGATARTREGTGIGLALVHELAGLHGGTVSVASEPGTGSTFTVALPFGAADVAGERGAIAPSEAARGEAAIWEEDTSRPAEPAPGARNAEVLVVDDNADMRAYLTRLLGRHWTVRTTANGGEALEAVAERAPDVVLTDVMMPRTDGFELLRRLRGRAETRHIPVIMLTARAGQEASVEGLEAGADDYLAKPFGADELIARVRVALERATGRSAAPANGASPAAARAVGHPVVEGSPAAAPAGVPVPAAPGTRPRPPEPRVPQRSRPGPTTKWRLPSTASSIPALRRRLRAWLEAAGLDEEHTYDVLLAACEAATNAFEHAQDPTQPYFDVTASIDEHQVCISVRDYGQWRERIPSMDRGRGSTLMSVTGEITATPSAEGTTVIITSPRTGRRSATSAG
ncbi:ATP-binding protein [Blastococcus mobilis]|uniref:histidine kinase n=1 Tax=Blastococcus mobilis TaxID=1938746 RepID=A0A238W1F8_9ACTN|nr:ATP-binding protein [Blastococcus mobilis]SNR40241.1 Histidine kinase-like ATPase domain-containing protein [Blastococcus mobilis]